MATQSSISQFFLDRAYDSSDSSSDPITGFVLTAVTRDHRLILASVFPPSSLLAKGLLGESFDHLSYLEASLSESTHPERSTPD
jgi:hypothetical protein